MYLDSHQFYHEVIEGKRPLKEIFSGMSLFMNANDFDELFDEFTSLLKVNFNSDDQGFIPESIKRFCNIPEPLSIRVRLVVMLLSVCALGAPFDCNVYSYSENFILKKELCNTELSLN